MPFQRRLPIGGLANGTPLNTAILFFACQIPSNFPDFEVVIGFFDIIWWYL